MSQNAIEVNDVSMKFNLSREKVDSLKDYIFKAIKGEGNLRRIQAHHRKREKARQNGSSSGTWRRL